MKDSQQTSDIPVAEPEASPAPAAKLRKGSSGFLGGVLALSGGTTIGQALTILAAPVISRLFGPQAFGIAAVFGSVVITFKIVSSMRYDLAMVLPKKDEMAANLLVLCLAIVLSLSALAMVVMATVGTSILGWFGAEELSVFRWLLPLAMLFSGLDLTLSMWNTRHKCFKRIAIARIAMRVVTITACVLAGFLGFRSGEHLFTARLFGMACMPIFLGWFFFRHDLGYVLSKCNPRILWDLAKRYKKFPLMNMWSALLSTGSMQLPVILLAGFFSKYEAGLFSMAMMLVQMPSTLISKAVGEVFFQRASELNTSGVDLGRKTSLVFVKLLLVGMLPAVIAIIVGTEIFGFVLGAKWFEAGLYVAILTPWLLLQFASFPIHKLFFVKERQGYELMINIIRFILRAGILIAGGLLIRDVVWTLIFYSACSFLITLWQTIYIFRITRVSLRAVLRESIMAVVYAVPSAAILALAKWYFKLPSVYIIMILPVCVVQYMIVVLRHDKELATAFRKIVGKIFGKRSQSTKSGS